VVCNPPDLLADEGATVIPLAATICTSRCRPPRCLTEGSVVMAVEKIPHVTLETANRYRRGRRQQKKEKKKSKGMIRHEHQEAIPYMAAEAIGPCTAWSILFVFDDNTSAVRPVDHGFHRAQSWP